MTAQIPDRLIHRGQTFDLCAAPLEDYLKRLPKARRPKFIPGSSANWRGYIATWEIIEQRLCLTGIDDALFEVDGEFHDATLETIFPHGPFPMPATWVTGALRCPEGRLRCYVHAGFASEYERDRMFLIEKGVVVEEWLIHNPPAPLHYLINPDGSRHYATAFHKQDLAPDEDPFPGDAPIEPWRVWGDPDWDICPSHNEEDGYVIGAFTRLPRTGNFDRPIESSGHRVGTCPCSGRLRIDWRRLYHGAQMRSGVFSQ